MKKKLISLLALLMALLMLLSLAACGSNPTREDDDERESEEEREERDDQDEEDEDEDEDNKGGKADKPDDTDVAGDDGVESAGSAEGPVLTAHTEFNDELTAFWGTDHNGPLEQEPSLDAEAIYAALEYTPEMFYGEYFLSGLSGDSAWSNAYTDPDAPLMTEFAENVSYMELDYDGQTATVSILPIAYAAGYETLSLWFYDPYYLESGLHWMTMSFLVTDGEDTWQGSLMGTFTVDGDKLIFAPILDYIYDADGGISGVEYLGFTVELEYAFCGPYLTLSNGGQQVELCARAFLEGEYPFVSIFARTGDTPSPILGGADELTFCHARYEGDDEDMVYFQVTPVDGYMDYDTPTGRFRENGLVQLSWEFQEGNVFETELVYFYCGDDGLVMTDGETTYYYTEGWSVRQARTISDNLTDEDAEKLKDLTDSQLEEIVETREELLTELADAFESAGLAVELDTESGEISLDSTILFGLDEAALSADGEAFLQEFLGVYASVILDGYSTFISGILIEGHTDTQGNYDYNLELSQQRADNVLAYCLSADNGLSAERTEELNGMLTAVGRSYDVPVLDENGDVDMAASRRVSFRFLLRIGA